MDKEIFRKGDRVYDATFGWGTVAAINNATLLPITVKFERDKIFYTIDGKTYPTAIRPTLSFTEYTLQGFSQERPIDYTEYIGKWGKFWDIDVKTCIIDRLIECKPDDEYYFTTSEFGYLNFEPLTDEQIKILNLE